jgi:hypothetical protein
MVWPAEGELASGHRTPVRALAAIVRERLSVQGRLLRVAVVAAVLVAAVLPAPH